MTDERCFYSDEGRVQIVILKRKTKVFKPSLKLKIDQSDDDCEGGSGRDFNENSKNWLVYRTKFRQIPCYDYRETFKRFIQSPIKDTEEEEDEYLGADMDANDYFMKIDPAGTFWKC